MKKLLIISSLIFVLCGCFAENYNVGHPIAYIKYDSKDIKLEPTFISWSTQGDQTSFKVQNMEDYTEELRPIEIVSGQLLKLYFQDSIDEDGEYSSIKIEVKVSRDEELILHYTEEPTSSFLEDQYMYQMPPEPGQYILQVEFSSSGGTAKYAGKLVVK
ncbi:hypothetical protein FZW96_00350 [Bacillus sp. BGMRC 2118]|nr:hypothetical protein FZW96_00350 [Bacillus sp. BGMRC 2118]